MSQADVSEDLEVEDAPGPRPPGWRPKHLRLNDEGCFHHDKAEYMLLMMADDVAPKHAWVAVGGKNTGYSFYDREAIVRNPLFRRRLEELLTEKADAEAEGPVGRVRWMASQVWRTARVKNDLPAMLKATDIMAKMADRDGSAPAAPASEKPKGGPGRPAVDARTGARRSPAALRAELMENGEALDRDASRAAAS